MYETLWNMGIFSRPQPVSLEGTRELTYFHLGKKGKDKMNLQTGATWVFPKIGVPPNHPLKNKVFHYKPSILGYHHFWKHPHWGFPSQTCFPLRTRGCRVEILKMATLVAKKSWNYGWELWIMQPFLVCLVVFWFVLFLFVCFFVCFFLCVSLFVFFPKTNSSTSYTSW